MPKSRTHAKRRAKQKGVQHNHKRYVPGCMRCELSRDESDEQAKQAQAEEPKENFSIDDLTRGA